MSDFARVDCIFQRFLSGQSYVASQKRDDDPDDEDDNNDELYLHDHTNTYSIAKAMFRNQNYNTGRLRYFDNNLSRTSKQAEIYFMNCILIK